MAPKPEDAKDAKVAKDAKDAKEEPKLSPEEQKKLEEKRKLKWRIVRVSTILTCCMFVALLIFYIVLISRPPHPLEAPMNELRSTLAWTLNKPDLAALEYPWTAEEAVQLSKYISELEFVFNEHKSQYQHIFKTGKPKGSGNWEMFERSLYYISKGKKTWYEAENFCLSRDSHIIAIKNEDEQKYISEKLNDTAWIGLRSGKEEDTWEWSDGSSLVIQYWAPGKPHRHSEGVKEKCVFINPTSDIFNWNDGSCYELKRWICKDNLHFAFNT